MSSRYSRFDMRILGIESSCDETAVAIVKGDGDSLVVENNLVASQAELHKKYGGVVPEVAARKHAEAIVPLLKEVGVPNDGEGIDAIAVTAGPGLSPSLRVGVEAAKMLAWMWDKPLVAANHLEGHVYSVWLPMATPSIPLGKGGTPKFPALCLLVSGGHTELILLKDHGQYELLGMTRDDAAGEAFDKVAKLLGLPYPGGPEISRLAEQGNPEAIDFPRPMLHSGDLDFSFSGLKTAVRVYLNEHGVPLPKGDNRGLPLSKPDIAASFQSAVVDTLVTKTLTAARDCNPASIILAGGVAANQKLRDELGAAIKNKLTETTFHAADRAYTGDNAAMIAAAGYFRARAKDFVDPLTLKADPNLRLAN
jgi:N6-L-threonylcarbamoyladenine synthase